MPEPKLLAVALLLDNDGDPIVELIYEDRRIGLFLERAKGKTGWFIASRGDRERDGSGYLEDGNLTSADILDRGLDRTPKKAN